MKRCAQAVDIGRRKFLTGAGMAAAGAAAAAVASPEAKAAPAPARVDYPSTRLANVGDLKVDEPLAVAYPDNAAPGVLLKLGKRLGFSEVGRAMLENGKGVRYLRRLLGGA